MKDVIQPWRLKLMMVLGLAPVFVGVLYSVYPWRSNANPTHRYPYAVVKMDAPSLENEVDFYRERIRRNPTDGLDRAALARTYLKLARSTGDVSYFHLAENSAQQSLDNLPVNNTEAQLVLARVAEAEHDFSTAITVAQQILKEQPANPEAQRLLATSHLAIGDLSEASQIAQHLVEQTPTLATLSLRALTYAAQGQDQDAVQLFQQALAAEEPGEVLGSAKTRTLMGRFYAQRGQIQQSRQLFQEALRIMPSYSFAVLEQAKLETQVGNYQQAETLYAQLSGTSDTTEGLDHEAIQGQALLKLLQGDRLMAEELWANAEDSFRHDHHSDPNHGEVHHHSTEHGHRDTHDHHHDDDSHHDDNSQTAHGFSHRRDLARLLLTRGDMADLPDALALMQAELQVRRDAESLEIYAWALQQSDRLQEAQDILQEAIALGTRDAPLFYRAARIARALGDAQQANAYLKVAQDIHPQFNPKLRQILKLG